MIFLILISLLLLAIIAYFTSGNLQWWLWYRFGKNLGVITYNKCTVYLSDNMPWGLSGRFFPPEKAFVKRSYYTRDGKNTNIEFIEATTEQLDQGFAGTKDIIQHEAGGHKEQFERLKNKYGNLLGTVMFYGWGLFNGIGQLLRIYKRHQNCPIEREPEKWERT